MRQYTKYEPALRKVSSHVRAVYTDLDHTLLGPDASLFLGPDRRYSLEPARALVGLLEAGIDVVPVSGRNNTQLKELARLFGLSNYVAELGCATYYEQGRKVVANHSFPVPAGSNLNQAIAASGAPALLLLEYQGLLEYHTPWSTRQECTHLFRGQVDIDEANIRLNDEGFSGLRLIDNGRCRSSTTLNSLPETHAYHLLPSEAGKAAAIRADQKHRNFSPAETIAFGDSLADLEMAAAVGLFFLVRNDLSTQPQIAKTVESIQNVYVTDSTMGLGWAEVVSKLLDK